MAPFGWNAALLTVLVAVASIGNTATAVSVCVAGHNAATACRKMEALKIPTPLTCFVTQDRYDCLLRLATKEADVALASAEDVFVAKEILDGELHVIGQTRSLSRRTESMRYDAVAVVRRATVNGLQDLKGSKSCHTGYRRTAGWHIPIAHLLEKKLVKLSCGSGLLSAEQDLNAISNFFSLACVPGHWAPDNKTNTALKSRYPNLCAMCRSPEDCGNQDLHAGYLGALHCLTESNGDVAWTKHDAVMHYFNTTEKQRVKGQYGLLCPDGSIRDIEQNCPWASRPWDAWLTRTGQDNIEKITKSLKMVMQAATIGNENVSNKVEDWATQVLGIRTPSTMVAFNPPTTPYKYLSTASYDVTIERLTCPDEPVRLCVTSSPARDKCRALSQMLKSRRVQPSLSCVLRTSSDGDCITPVAEGRADIASLDGGDVFKAHVEYDLVPLVTERYGLQESSYFAVAVVKANSGINGLSDLRGKKSCHTGIGRTAGWKIPIVALLEAGLFQRNKCNYAHQMGGLFSASCVPGAKSPMYDPKGDNPESLCQLCVGTLVDGVDGPHYNVAGGEGRCDRGAAEGYSGYSGAFRCLVEGGGDVAFIKHTTVGENINSGSANISWAKGLQSQDFRLLCKGSGSADIVDFATCHLARVPSHKVVINNKLSINRKEEARVLMLAASNYFPPGQNAFVMFGPFHDHNDLIFKDSATELVNLPDDVFHNSLDQAYYHMLTELQACTPDLDSNVYSSGTAEAYDTSFTADGQTLSANNLQSVLVVACGAVLALLRSVRSI